MAAFTRGFRGRRSSDPALPPGQYTTNDFPVLSAGPTPRVESDAWRFTITTVSGHQTELTWSELLALPSETPTVDIHCVTRWSKIATSWRGVSVDVVLSGIDVDGAYVMVESYGGYTTNLPLVDIQGGKAWIAYQFEGEPLEPVHGGPARLLVPHLYFWKSAKWVRGLRFLASDEPGFWEGLGYNMYGDPWREQRYTDD
ncbi:MAG TPA: sulfite oxidase-like oxidoreductase [Acidimicrobiales bacterium]|nr:sulfite oxidase-like oxidoreductase [Acidimicrobiales bacterium]